jgi:hypothetical protein
LIAYAHIGGAPGEHALSSNFLDPGTAWTAKAASIISEVEVSALETDNKQMVSDADQWNFNHQTWNGASSTAIPLRDMLFLRGGESWSNLIRFVSGGAPIEEIQLSFLFNAATRGDKQATVPVIKWTGLGITDVDLNVTLKHTGNFNIALWLYNGTNFQIFDMPWIVVE